MNEKNSYKGFHYWLYETRGKYFCRIFAESNTSALCTTEILETQEQAISKAKKQIEDFHKDTNKEKRIKQ